MRKLWQKFLAFLCEAPVAIVEDDMQYELPFDPDKPFWQAPPDWEPPLPKEKK